MSYGSTPPPPPTPPSSTPPPPSPGAPPPSRKGFFGALFDFSFETFITPMIVKVVYLIGTIVIGLVWLGFLVTGFATSAAYGIVVLIIGPFVALIYLAMFRMTLEFYLALVRMSDDIHHRGLG